MKKYPSAGPLGVRPTTWRSIERNFLPLIASQVPAFWLLVAEGICGSFREKYPAPPAITVRAARAMTMFFMISIHLGAERAERVPERLALDLVPGHYHPRNNAPEVRANAS